MLFFKYFSKLPFFVLYGISDFAYFIIYQVVGYRKKVVIENLRNSFPDKTESEIKQITKNFYKHISDLFIEFLKGYSISKDEISKRVKIVNLNVIKKYTDKNQSVIIVTGHIGNWEWLLHSLNLIGIPVDIVYQKLSSPLFEKLTLYIRSRFATTPLIEKHSKRNRPTSSCPSCNCPCGEYAAPSFYRHCSSFLYCGYECEGHTDSLVHGLCVNRDLHPRICIFQSKVITTLLACSSVFSL